MKKILSMLLAMLILLSIATPPTNAKVTEEKSRKVRTTVEMTKNKEESANIWDGTVAEGFAGGTGTESDPYRIETGSQLAYLGKQVNSGITYSGMYIKLAADIVLNDTSNWENWENNAPQNEWTPIGAYIREGDEPIAYRFSGIFDGDDHTVSGIYVCTATHEKIGLFGTAEDAVVKNVCCIKAYIYRSQSQIHSKVGVLIGDAIKSTVMNCYTTGSVNATTGNNRSVFAGGLIGLEEYSTVNNCYSTVNITGKALEAHTISAGGLIGYDSYGVISNCYATGDVHSLCTNSTEMKHGFSGGLAGASAGMIEKSYATGDVFCTSQSGHALSGGLVGYSAEAIVSCYATGNVYAIAVKDEYAFAGGLAGVVDGSVTNCYRYINQIIKKNDTEGSSNSYGDEKVLSILQSENFCINTLDWSSDIWYFKSGVFPQLKWSCICTVEFIDWDNTVLKRQEVERGKSATAPENPTRTGHTFIGWDKPFNNVTSNLKVAALYTINEYTVRFVDYDASVLKTETVEYASAATAPDEPTRIGYTFLSWDRDFSCITSDLTVTALYIRNTTYVVTFKDWNGTILKEQSVEEGSSAVAPTEPTRAGYIFVGWDKDFSNITSDLTVTAQYVIDDSQMHTVVFKDWDGVTLKTELVEHGKNATAPQDPVREGYIFLGWSKDFSCVTCDLTVVAQYQKIGDISITLQYEKYSSYVGEEFKLEFTVIGISSMDVYWTTSDASIATVNENGVVRSHMKGEVLISVVSNDGKYFSTCRVTVHGMGDVNDDGVTNTADAVRILMVAAGLTVEAAINIHTADVNYDGKINTADAVYILKYAAGLIHGLD